MKEENFNKFGEEFEKKLVFGIIQDSAFAESMKEILDFKYFYLDSTKELSREIFQYKMKYHQHPGLSTVKMFLGEAFDDSPDALRTSIENLVNEFDSYEKERDSIQYVKDKARDFCKKRHSINAIVSAYERVQKKDGDYDTVIHQLQNSLSAGEKKEKGYDYLLDFDRRFEERARYPVTTGWQKLDMLMGGGLGKGELGCIIASSGSGKSFVLTALGAAALSEGKNVLHFTLELSPEVIANRYDANLTDISLGELVENKEIIREKIKSLEGGLIVVNYPMRFATTETIRSKINDLINNHKFRPDMIIVDYAELLKPLFVSKERRQDVESIFEELRGLGQFFECPVWTASQTNRGGLEKEVVQLADVAEAYAKVFPCDVVMTLARTTNDKASNGGRFLLAKNRNGSDGVVLPLDIDWSRAYIQITDQEYSSMTESRKQAIRKDTIKALEMMNKKG